MHPAGSLYATFCRFYDMFRVTVYTTSKWNRQHPHTVLNNFPQFSSERDEVTEFLLSCLAAPSRPRLEDLHQKSKQWPLYIFFPRNKNQKSLGNETQRIYRMAKTTPSGVVTFIPLLRRSFLCLLSLYRVWMSDVVKKISSSHLIHISMFHLH